LASRTTLDPTISRLLPNHYLDLTTWQAVRHHPKTFDPMHDADVPHAVSRLVSVLQRQIGAVLHATTRLYMPLTAGLDSRTLLACSRFGHEGIEYVTFDYTPWRQRRSEQLDLDVARRLARRVGLRHTVVPISANVPAVIASGYLHRTGFSGGNGKAWDFEDACQRHLDLSGGWLTGFAGEVGRAFYWHAGDRETERWSPAELLTRLHLPASPRLQEAMRRWLAGLPDDLPLSSLLGLAYLEHRIGCWAAPHLYGAAPFAVNLTPFCHREAFDLMLRLPPEYRKRKALARDICTATWPELLSLPFNAYPGLRGLREGMRAWLRRSAARTLGGQTALKVGMRRLTGRSR
jgi:hypothetical protein